MKILFSTVVAATYAAALMINTLTDRRRKNVENKTKDQLIYN